MKQGYCVSFHTKDAMTCKVNEVKIKIKAVVLPQGHCPSCAPSERKDGVRSSRGRGQGVCKPTAVHGWVGGAARACVVWGRGAGA